jgi:hypothetical protein
MSYFRPVRHINEKRSLYTAADYTVKVRGKRSLRNLPDDWDDKPRCWMRSWKKHRKTQYKL